MLTHLKSRKMDSSLYPLGYLISQRAYQEFEINRILSEHPHVNHKGRQVLIARFLSREMNTKRDFTRPETRPARAGEMLAMGLLTDILRYVISLYCEEFYGGVLERTMMWTRLRTESRVVDLPTTTLIRLYPPKPVLDNDLSAEDFLEQRWGGLKHREVALRELVLLALSMENPALKPYRELFDDSELRESSPATLLLEHTEQYFGTQPPFPEYDLPLMEMLRAPIRHSPDDIEGQLEFLRERWQAILPEELLERLHLTRGVLQEERVMRGLGPGPQEVLEFGGGSASDPEYEAFTKDREWMPNVVLIAKTVYVWLDQLSKHYKRPIHRLDQIPDEELDRLAGWGFTGLWLIGLWERSEASRDIKARMGNPEAAASAYSLYDYVIAHDLGGEAALQNLKQRAQQRGIRLASDMVPNHVGIYSRWVIEHPDWFIQLRHTPFPGYNFTGPDLSPNERVSIYIEDGYWNHSDAAVVFKRVDQWSGDTRYIYHGNDGTSMPWNDTAQLNYLIPEVREAVIQTILHVARQFSIIRFDAAMTLAKKHFQRLWFPTPGDGGGIPSRAEHGMTRADFDRVFPQEFWRDVVDRIAAEQPDTLLLAEAFWLMEGYFVRTLGMHRVYNSAFMNMLKMEDNGKFRQTIKNVLEFSPAILQRFVNFMNNPDEDTAFAQFGDGDKYFGVCMLLSTMPGLPMFGHGQIEGYHEKYGMEYRRAYYDETPNDGLIARHEKEIFPLLQRRWLFSGARQFALYDFVTPEGWVDENVIAYSNCFGAERVIVLYNNTFGATRGVVHTSTAINVGSADDKQLQRRTLGEALGLNTADNCYYIVCDLHSGLEYLHHAGSLLEEGLHTELHAYQYHVFADWREVFDTDLTWGKLHSKLGGAGVPSVQESYQELHLAPILEPLRGFINGAMLQMLADHDGDAMAQKPFQAAFSEYLNAIRQKTLGDAAVDSIVARTLEGLEPLFEFPEYLASLKLDDVVLDYIREGLAAQAATASELDEEGEDKAEADLELAREQAARESHDAMEVFEPTEKRPDLAKAEPEAKATVVPTFLQKQASLDLVQWRVPLVWGLLRHMGALVEPPTRRKGVEPDVESTLKSFCTDLTSAAWMREWFLVKPITAAYLQLDEDAWAAASDARLVRICTGHMPHLLALEDEVWGPILDHLFWDADVQHYLLVNVYQGRRYVNKERLDHMLFMLFLCATLALYKHPDSAADRLLACHENLLAIQETAEAVGYDLENLLGCLK